MTSSGSWPYSACDTSTVPCCGTHAHFSCIEAVEEGDTKHVAEEVADLTYFMLTACVAGGATLEQVARCLDLSALKVKRRQGDAKQHRIDAAAAVLNANNPPASPSVPHAHHSLSHATSSAVQQ